MTSNLNTHHNTQSNTQVERHADQSSTHAESQAESNTESHANGHVVNTRTLDTAPNIVQTTTPAHGMMHTDPQTAQYAESHTAWRMLHPAALIVDLAETIKGVLGLFFGLLILMREHLSPLMIILIVVGTIVVALSQPTINWLTTRYQLGTDGLSFTSGLFFRKNRTISYGSIHAINSSSPFYLQPFHVVRLTVSAAGAEDNDIRLNAVPASLQYELERRRASACGTSHDPSDTHSSSRNNSQAGSQTTSQANSNQSSPRRTLTEQECPPAESERILTKQKSIATDQTPLDGSNILVFRASVKDIALYAITDISIIAAAFIVYGFVERVQDVLPRTLVRDTIDSISLVAAHGTLTIALLILACLMLLTIVSLVSSLLRFYGFEVWRHGDDLIVVRGLFTRHTTTIPVSRIQTVIIRQSLLRRPFHLCSVGIGLSSSATSTSEESGISAARILPVINTRRVYIVLRAMLPEWDVRDVWSTPQQAHTPMQYTGRGLLRYYLAIPMLITLILTLIVWLGSDARLATALRHTLPALNIEWPWWMTFVPIIIGLGWIAARWLKSHEEGYCLLDNDICTNHDNTDSQNANLDAHALPNRILVSGAKQLTRYIAITRKSRVQSLRHTTTLWREHHGIYSVSMPLFVTNGINAIRFMFMRREDVNNLEHWLKK